MNESRQLKVANFYNNYWPKNVPDYNKTRKHILSLIPKKKSFKYALDAGCGTGVCSIALSEIAKKVIGVDISAKSVLTARDLSQKLKLKNLRFAKANILNLPYKKNTFDLILSWGVIHHTEDPKKALDELVRVLRPEGTLIIAVYLKTNLTFIHELVRAICIKTPFFPKRFFIKTVALTVKLAEQLGKTNNPRNDNILIESQVEDWFFVPQKYFFSMKEGIDELKKRGVAAKVIVKQTGRFKSSSNFILRGIKI